MNPIRIISPFFLLLLFFMTDCSGNEPVTESNNSLIDVKGIKLANDSLLQEAKKIIRTGDLLLRTGNDFSSDQVKDMSSSDKTFSHGGIAVIEDSGIFVYHVEPDFYYLNDKVRKEKVDSFFARSRNIGFGVARYTLDSLENRRFIDYLEMQYKNRVAFDMSFDLKTDDRMYCSEMIKKGLAKASNNRIEIEVIKMHDKSKYKIIKQYFKLKEKQFVNREIIPIDRLFLNPNCTLLKRFVYQH